VSAGAADRANGGVFYMVKGGSSGSSNRSSRSGPVAERPGTVAARPEPNGPGAESKPPGTNERNAPSAGRPNALPAGLIVVATPIGNAGDLGLRARDVLAGASRIACEDTRVTAKLLALYGIQTPTLSYHEHNARAQRPRIMEHLKNGETVALVSDAGTPLISDPGYKLITACLEEGVPLTAVPGASSVMTALVLSGLPTDRFFFQGFLPPKSGPRRQVLRELAAVPGTLVIMESAKRLRAMLADAAAELGPRPAAVTRELTKKFEEVRRGELPDLVSHYADAGPPKGEVTVVIGPPLADAGIDDTTLDAQLRTALAGATVRDAAALVTAATGLPKRRVYARALELSKDNG